MSKPKPIYRTDGEWVALIQDGHLFDTLGEWVGWLDGDDVYSSDGEYVGYISKDARLLRKRVAPYHRQRRPPRVRPRCSVPSSVPLPPLFAELSYNIIDVFEENPDIFAIVSELRPDAGEGSLSRLADDNPYLAEQERIRSVKRDMLEQMAHTLIYSYGATEPPVPIESMATGRRPEGTGDVQTASPDQRWRLASQLIQQLGRSSWAMQRGFCGPEGFTAPQVEYAARALLMPREWILKTSKAMRRPWVLARRYAVPESVAVLRLHDLE